MGWQNGNDYRWSLRASSYPPSISVIEPADDDKPQEGHRVSFGFARVLAPPVVERDPLLWEGED